MMYISKTRIKTSLRTSKKSGATGYFIEENFAEHPKQEVNEIQSWDDQTPEDLQEVIIQAESKLCLP